jgi:hypothetical protein
MNQQFASVLPSVARVIEIDMIADDESIPVIMTDQEVPQPIGVEQSIGVEQFIGVEQSVGRLPPADLIQSLCGTLKEMRNDRSITLPIKKISNISVEVIIRKQTKNKYILHINPTDFSVGEDESLYIGIYDNNCGGAAYVRQDDKFIEHVVHCTLLSLKNIKIDKLYGLLTNDEPSLKEKKIRDMWAIFCQEFKDDEHMEMTIKECCVCFTMTQSRTNCDHSVCLECISKLKPVEIVDGAKHIGCPMCRQRITSLL